MRHLNFSFILSTVIFIFTLALTVEAQVTPTPTPTPTPEEPERVETEEIKINVLAYDADRKFVEGVRVSDVVITENNILHQATSIRRIPANIVIIMDTGGALRQAKTLDTTRRTAAALVSTLRPQDAIAIVQYSDQADVVSGLTTDRAATTAAINRTNFGLGSEFLAAIRLASGLLTKPGIENRHLVLITDGTDTTLSGSSRERSLRPLLETDINVHVISYTRIEAIAAEPLTKKVSTKPEPATAEPIAMPREMAEQLPAGARDFKTSPKVGPTISLDRKRISVWKQRKADLESAERQLAVLAENANGIALIPQTTEEMIDKAALVAGVIDDSYVLTYMPKIPLSEKRIDRNIVVTSKRPDLIIQGKRRLTFKKN